MTRGPTPVFFSMNVVVLDVPKMRFPKVMLVGLAVAVPEPEDVPEPEELTPVPDTST